MKVPKMSFYYYLRFRSFLDELAFKIRFNEFQYRYLWGTEAEEEE